MNQYSYIKNKIYDLTPIEEYDGIYYKRDDLFKPFDGEEDYNQINGGKLRQCISLFFEKEKEIREKYNNTVATVSSLESPQSVIISRVAKEFGFQSFIGVGNTNIKNAVKHKPIRMSQELGSEIDVISTQAFNNVLFFNLKKIIQDKPMFAVMFGINYLESAESVIDVISYQVQNIPDDIDTLIVPVGSGITFGSIMKGILKYDKKIKRIVAIQPFGYDRRKTIENIIEEMSIFYSYEYHRGNYSYNKKLNINVGFELDNIYESKTFDMMIKNDIIDKEKTCFWVVGNNNITRQ